MIRLLAIYHLQINISKTKTMIANYRYLNPYEDSYPESIVNLDNVPVENVRTFRYLGDYIKFNEPTSGDTEIDLRISVAENKFRALSRTLCNRNIKLETRIYTLNTMVRGRLIYSCQTWNVNQIQMNRINSTYMNMNMMRKMIRDGYKRRNETEADFSFVYSNDDVLNICKTDNI